MARQAFFPTCLLPSELILAAPARKTLAAADISLTTREEREQERHLSCRTANPPAHHFCRDALDIFASLLLRHGDTEWGGQEGKADAANTRLPFQPPTQQ